MFFEFSAETNQPTSPTNQSNQRFGEAAAERKKLFRTKSQLMAEEEEERRKARVTRADPMGRRHNISSKEFDGV